MSSICTLYTLLMYVVHLVNVQPARHVVTIKQEALLLTQKELRTSKPACEGIMYLVNRAGILM